MTKPGVGAFLDNANFGFPEMTESQRPIIQEFVPTLQPVVSVDELLKERIEFQASKTIAGAPAGFAFTTPPVAAQEIEVWDGLWLFHTDAGAGNVIVTLTQTLNAFGGGIRGRVQIANVDGSSPLLAAGIANATFPNHTTPFPLVLSEGGFLTISSSVLLAVASVITVTGTGYRIRGPRFAARDITQQVTVN